MIAIMIFLFLLVGLGGLFFRSRSLRKLADRELFGTKRKSVRKSIPLEQTSSAIEPLSVIISNRYVSGRMRPEPDFPTVSATTDRTFASATEHQSSMTDWNALVVQPAIGEDGEPELPDETMPGLMPQPSFSAEIRDPEVHALLGSLEAGERVITDDATDEELQAIENFDMRAYV